MCSDTRARRRASKGKGSQVLTPNICLRSGSLNLKGMLETWSRFGCVLFSVLSEDCVCCWLSVCAASSVCCEEEPQMKKRDRQKESRILLQRLTFSALPAGPAFFFLILFFKYKRKPCVTDFYMELFLGFSEGHHKPVLWC